MGSNQRFFYIGNGRVRFDEPTNRSLRLHFAYLSLSYESNGLLTDIAPLNGWLNLGSNWRTKALSRLLTNMRTDPSNYGPPKLCCSTERIPRIDGSILSPPVPDWLKKCINNESLVSANSQAKIHIMLRNYGFRHDRNPLWETNLAQVQTSRTIRKQVHLRI